MHFLIGIYCTLIGHTNLEMYVKEYEGSQYSLYRFEDWPECWCMCLVVLVLVVSVLAICMRHRAVVTQTEGIYRWPPSCQSLVRIIEKKMKDSILAQGVVNNVDTTTTECTHNND